MIQKLSSSQTCAIKNTFIFARQVYNVIPSISAITGISPQRYLWRICVALHIGPRIVIAFVYNTYYLSRLPTIPKDDQAKYKRLLRICYWLNVIEIASLLGVTYVSNRENYRTFLHSITTAIILINGTNS